MKHKPTETVVGAWSDPLPATHLLSPRTGRLASCPRTFEEPSRNIRPTPNESPRVRAAHHAALRVVPWVWDLRASLRRRRRRRGRFL